MNQQFRFPDHPVPPFGGSEDPLVMYNPHTGWMAWKPPSGQQLPFPPQFPLPPHPQYQQQPFPGPHQSYPLQFPPSYGYQTPMVPLQRGYEQEEETDIVHIGDVTPQSQPQTQKSSYSAKTQQGTDTEASECEMCKDLGVSSKFHSRQEMEEHSEKHGKQLSMNPEDAMKICFPSEVVENPETRNFYPTSPEHLPEIDPPNLSLYGKTPRKTKSKDGSDPPIETPRDLVHSYKQKFAQETSARCYSTLTPTLVNLIKELVATAVHKNSINCRFDPYCKFIISDGVNNFKPMFKATCHHFIQHYPEKLYYCKVCSREVTSSEHQRAHPKQKMRKIMMDCFNEKEEELIQLFHKCFTNKSELEANFESNLGTWTSEAEVEVDQKPAKRRKRSVSKPIVPLKPNTPFDMSKGVPGRTTTAAVPQEIYKVSQWMVRAMAKSKVSIKCQYSVECDGTWKAERKLERDTHTATMSIFTHVLRHLNEPLFYCSKCNVWEIKPENHRNRLHKGELPPDFIIDFLDFRKKELALIFVACFPDQSKPLDEALKSLDISVPLSTTILSKPRDTNSNMTVDKVPKLERGSVSEDEETDRKPLKPGFLTEKIARMAEDMKKTYEPGMDIKCQLCPTYNFPPKQGLPVSQSRKYLKRSLLSHVLRHMTKELYYCKLCNKSVRSGEAHAARSHVKDEAKTIITTTMDQHEHELNEKFKECFLSG